MIQGVAAKWSFSSLSAGRLRQKRSKARQVLQIIDLWDFFHIVWVPLKVTDKPKKDMVP